MSARLELHNKTNKIQIVSVTKALAAAANYDAEDVLSESASAGTAWIFTVVGIQASSGIISNAVALLETTALTPRIRLYLFNAVPTSALNDNVANTAVLHADEANYIGSIELGAMSDLGGDSEANAAEGTAGLSLRFKTGASDNRLYGIAVTEDAITGETATDDLIIKLTIERD